MNEAVTCLSKVFQSTPGFWAGRYNTATRSMRVNGCFNPLPAFGPGDTALGKREAMRQQVSIHSRLLGREIP